MELLAEVRHRWFVWRNFRHPMPMLDLREWLFTHMFCRFGRHCRYEHQVQKFNGGNTCWLCRNCYLILWYDRDRG